VVYLWSSFSESRQAEAYRTKDLKFKIQDLKKFLVDAHVLVSYDPRNTGKEVIQKIYEF